MTLCCHDLDFIKPLTSRNVWRNIGRNGTSQHQCRAARSALLQMFVYGACTRTPRAPWDNGPQRTTSTEDLFNPRYERIRSSSPLGTKNVQPIPSISAKECTVLGTKKSQHICQRRDFLVPGGLRTMYSLADMLGIGWALLVSGGLRATYSLATVGARLWSWHLLPLTQNTLPSKDVREYVF